MVGTGVITFPAAFYLMATGAIPAGVGLLIWGVLIVGLIDNILRPFLMNRDTHIHSFLILLSVFGGLSYFGPIGFLAGPIVLAFFFVLLDIYPEIVEGKALESDRSVVLLTDARASVIFSWYVVRDEMEHPNDHST